MVPASTCRSCRPMYPILLIALLGLFAPWDQAKSQETIRLLSDEAADACIADVDCMRGLFLAATIGHREGSTAASEQLFKWTGHARMAVLGGDDLREEVDTRSAATLEQVGLLGKAAGLDIESANQDDVVNLLLLVSSDFARDRDGTFAALFETVFAGRADFYDQLTAGNEPLCESRRFVDGDGSIGGGVAAIGQDAAAIERCLYRVLLQILGLRHPLPKTSDSLLNPDSERESWTAIDFLLLKFLYNPMIKPGMDVKALTEVFPQVYDAVFSS